MNTFLQAILSCEDICKSYEYNENCQLHNILDKIRTEENAIDSKHLLEILKQNKAFNDFVINEKSDAMTFGEVFVNQFYSQCKSFCKVNHITPVYMHFIQIYKLKCGHEIRKNKKCPFLMLQVYNELDIQKNVYGLSRFSDMKIKSSRLCQICKKHSGILYLRHKITSVPNYLLLEIERGYSGKDGIVFTDLQIRMPAELKLKGDKYSIIGAIIYKNAHYTYIYDAGDYHCEIDNSEERIISHTRFIDQIEEHARCIVMRKIQ